MEYNIKIADLYLHTPSDLQTRIIYVHSKVYNLQIQIYDELMSKLLKKDIFEENNDLYDG
jgi:hypothetical protein